MGVCVCARVRAHTHVCTHTCAHACACAFPCEYMPYVFRSSQGPKEGTGSSGFGVLGSWMLGGSTLWSFPGWQMLLSYIFSTIFKFPWKMQDTPHTHTQTHNKSTGTQFPHEGERLTQKPWTSHIKLMYVLQSLQFFPAHHHTSYGKEVNYHLIICY